MKSSQSRRFPVPAKAPKSTNGFMKDGPKKASLVDNHAKKNHASLTKYALGTASRTTRG